MQDSILEALFAVVIFFFPAVPAFGPYITGLMDKRNVESSRGITTWKQYNDCLTAFKFVRGLLYGDADRNLYEKEPGTDR
jgi:hypothetical protein